MDVVTIVEIDVPFCALTYGNAPCEAALGVTGERKCFNSRRTCQDVQNFDPEPLTLRFMRASANVEAFDGIPALRSVRVTPQEINPGVDLGKRESVRIEFEDLLHTDAGLDKYLDERGYNPLLRGTFWGRFRARYPSLKGAPLRVKRGEVGQDPATMTTWHYVVESTAGPAGGVYTIVAKDVLKLADGDRAQAPRASSGILAAPITASDVSATLSPTGIGDLEYPASGRAAIGGSELVSFTRVGDVLTLTGRGVSNTTATDHAEEERVQLVLRYDSETVADILYDLLTGYTDIDPLTLPLADWQQEVDTNLGRLYSAEIAEPTAVRKLVNELIEQAGLVVWTDTLAQLVRLVVLRPIAASSDTFTDSTIREGSFKVTEQPGKRVSQSWTFYGLRNPLLRVDERSSYGGIAILPDLDAEVEYDGPAIKQIFSRWITQANRAAAERVNELQIARYRDPPRKLAFNLWRTETPPELGRGLQLEHHELQDDTGDLETVPAQVTSLEITDEGFEVMAEEMLFADVGSGERVVVIDQNVYGVNLRRLYDTLYTAPDVYHTVVFVIETGVQVGGGFTPSLGEWHSSGVSVPASVLNPDALGIGRAITVGDWPEGPKVRIVNNGTIAGSGANGSDARFDNLGGGAGGTGIFTRYPVEIENNGLIGGGGGGGGRGSSHGGGGGAGSILPAGNSYGETPAASTGGPNTDWPGNPTSHGGPGLLETGGASGGGTAGAGGDLGQAGETGSGGPGTSSNGGPGGPAVDGASFVTWAPKGDVRGSEVN